MEYTLNKFLILLIPYAFPLIKDVFILKTSNCLLFFCVIILWLIHVCIICTVLILYKTAEYIMCACKHVCVQIRNVKNNMFEAKYRKKNYDKVEKPYA